MAYNRIYNDWWYDIMGTYGLNMRMGSWDFMNHYKVALPDQCFLFADSWIYGFDHVWTGDNWFAPRHGTNREIVNVMFHDGHTQGYRYAGDDDDELPKAESCEYGIGTPWFGGDDQWRY